MSDEDKIITSIAEGAERVNSDRIAKMMDESHVAIHAQKMSLPEIGMDDLRAYITAKGFHEKDVMLATNFGSKAKARELRLAIHVLAKELLLAKQAVYVTNLSALIAAVGRASQWDEGVWLDEYSHILVCNFFSKGAESPMSASQRQQVTDYLLERYDSGLHTHVQILDCTETEVQKIQDWYGSAFWKMYKGHQSIFSY